MIDRTIRKFITHGFRIYFYEGHTQQYMLIKVTKGKHERSRLVDIDSLTLEKDIGYAIEKSAQEITQKMLKESAL